jgi:hypothetical protein
MDIPFEFCALRFLILWETEEKKLHSALRTSPPLALDYVRKSLNHYGVARNFKGLSQDKTAAFIQKSLCAISDTPTLTPEKKVVKLAKKFKGKFRQHNLSASSKLLWLRNKTPYILYDKRAVDALSAMDPKFNKSDYQKYQKYCKSWRSMYSKKKKDILRAAEKLKKIPRDFMPPSTPSDEKLFPMVTKKWFLERIFDIYLWEKGKQAK